MGKWRRNSEGNMEMMEVKVIYGSRPSFGRNDNQHLRRGRSISRLNQSFVHIPERPLGIVIALSVVIRPGVQANIRLQHAAMSSWICPGDQTLERSKNTRSPPYGCFVGPDLAIMPFREVVCCVQCGLGLPKSSSPLTGQKTWNVVMSRSELA